MNYQVLANKWRPKFFKDIIGQEHILISLINSFLLNRIHHAYIFYGIRGVGKTTIARLLSKSLNCLKYISYNPCGYCNNCKQIDNGVFVDLIEIDAASKTKVEDTRDILDNIYYKPIQGRFKIYIIDEFHMLSHYSFNALLKTLEEPPEHVKFLLATTNINKIPETILSRCFKFNLKKIKKKQIYYQLKKILKIEKIEFDINSLKSLAYAANGSMRDALTLTEQAIVIGEGKININIVNKMLGFLNNEYPIYILELVVNNNVNKIMDQIIKLSLINIDWDNLLIEILTILHNLLIMNLLNKKKIYNKYINIKYRLYNLYNILPLKIIKLYYKIILFGRKTLIYSPNKKIGVEIILLEILSINFKKSDFFLLNNKKKFFYIKHNIKKKSKNNLFFFLNFIYINKKKKFLINVKYFNIKKKIIDIINFNIKTLLFNNINNFFNNLKYKNINIDIKIKYIILKIKKKIKFIILNFNYINNKNFKYYLNNINIKIKKIFKKIIKLFFIKYKNIYNNYFNLIIKKNKKYRLIINKIKKKKNIKKIKLLFNIKFNNS
ncbi:MAG: DNA polymerase III subunit gamma/tau [Enterobacteriaceae bacterium PSpyr]|nr:MAG: DNA polymerase III subunit gamma/tau [Enterobacteriaceae bacterium PSpyr]